MEPIGGQASGVNVPHPSFARGARAICHHHGIRLVFDESVCAFRTGRLLAAHHTPTRSPTWSCSPRGWRPGTRPLGAALVPAPTGGGGRAGRGFVVAHSYDANPIACAAGAAVLDEILERDLIAHAGGGGGAPAGRPGRIAAGSPLVGDVRGRGLLLAIELVAEGETMARFPAQVDPGAVVAPPRPGARTAPLLAAPECRSIRRLAVDRPAAHHRRGRVRRPARAAGGDPGRRGGGAPAPAEGAR